MNFSETLKLAFASIWAHKLRSFLTLLGMIIGVAVFMLVVSIVLGFSSYFDETIAGIGSSSFTIRRFSFDDFKDTDTIAAAQRRNKELTFEERDFIKDRAQLLEAIAVKALPNQSEVKRGTEKLFDVRTEGCEPVVADIDKYDIAEGRYFTNAENDNAVRVVYIGKDVADKMFPFGSAVDQEINVRGIPYKVVGVQTAKGTVFGQPQDKFIQMPVKTYAANFGALTQSRGIYFIAKAKSDNLSADAVEEVRTLLRMKRKLSLDEKDNFGILTPEAIAGLKNRMLGPVGAVAVVVPFIALIIGAIVIMNIMLVAVTERTREIGIRKALGARQSDILKQFICESATLSAIGGFIGLIIAQLGGIIVSQLFIQTSIPVWAIFLSIGVSALVGILAGLFPAWKAARLDPIEALRAD
jgi:putative ABC transport system permease protein